MGKPSKHGRFFGFMKSYFGQDTYGHDVKAFGDTTGKYVEWDASADSLNVVGSTALTGAVNAVGAVAVTGTLAVNGLGFVVLTTAITANSTTTTATKGSIGITSNATGVGSLFISDGTKWQFAVVA